MKKKKENRPGATRLSKACHWRANVESDGEYLLKWDNTFSYLTAKPLTYAVHPTTVERMCHIQDSRGQYWFRVEVHQQVEDVWRASS